MQPRPEQMARDREETDEGGGDEARRGRRGRRGGRNRSRRREGERNPAQAAQGAAAAEREDQDAGVAMANFQPPSPERTDEGSAHESAAAAPQAEEDAPVPVDHRLAFVPEAGPAVETAATEPVTAFPAQRTFTRPEPDSEAAAPAVHGESAASQGSSTETHS